VARLAVETHVNDAQRRLLALAFGSSDLRIAPLSGGLRARCYRVTADSIDAAVRLPGQHGIRLSHDVERALSAKAAAAGIAPPVLDTPQALGLIATRFLAEARPWAPADARKPDNIDRASALLARLHALDVELQRLVWAEVAEGYVRSAQSHRTLSVEQRRWRDELLVLAREFDACEAPLVPCHNDLVASNFLDDGKLYLVDFEFATQAAALLDLASLAAFNAFDANARQRLSESYASASGAPVDVAALERMIRLVRLLAFFWLLAEPSQDDAAGTASAFADGVAAMLR